MKHITITSIIAIMMTIPSFAAVDINANATSADCDNNTLHTTTGPATLTADWSANTINLEWYSDDTKLTVPTASNTCIYDGGITIPTTNPTKPGYEFAGWQVRQMLFEISRLMEYTTEAGIDDAYVANNTSTPGEKAASFGLTTSGDWAVEFEYAIIKGTSVCVNNYGDNHNQQWGGSSADWTSTGSNFTSAYDRAGCWCKITGIDPEKDKTYQPVQVNKWVFYFAFGQYSANPSRECYQCAYGCADKIKNTETFREAVFSQVN